MMTKKATGGVIRVPLKQNATINANGIVCTDSSGYAVPGANTAGLKFVGIAKTGGANTANGNANGDVWIQVYTVGIFLMAATSITQAMVGAIMYCNGAATVDDSTSQSIVIGRLVGYVNNNLGWIDIGVSAAGNAGDKGATGDKGADGDYPAGIIVINSSLVTSREDNIDGLGSAISLATDLQAKLNAHAADNLAHTTAIDNVNFPDVSDVPTNLTTLKAITQNLLNKYAAHEADAAKSSAWAFHRGQELAPHTLASAVAPTTLQECITRLNDLKAKYNAHADDSSAHDNHVLNQCETGDAFYGAIILVPEPNVLSGDTVFWHILNGGTGAVTGVAADVEDTGVVGFAFSADPQNDAIISYMVARLGS